MSLFKLCWTDSRESSGPKPQMSILLSYLKTRMYGCAYVFIEINMRI